MMTTLMNSDRIRVKLDFSLIVALIIFEWYLASVYIPTHFSSFSAAYKITIATSINVILTVSLTIHELAHIITASLLGIRIRKLIVFIFGGVYDLAIDKAKGNNNADSGSRQLKFALAGPLASAGFAALLILVWILEYQEVNPKEEFLLKEAMSALFVYGAIGNSLLALINLMPLLPLDGARIFNSIIPKERNKHLRKTTQKKIENFSSLGLLITGTFFVFFYDMYLGFFVILLAGILRAALQEYTGIESLPKESF